MSIGIFSIESLITIKVQLYRVMPLARLVNYNTYRLLTNFIVINFNIFIIYSYIIFTCKDKELRDNNLKVSTITCLTGSISLISNVYAALISS